LEKRTINVVIVILIERLVKRFLVKKVIYVLNINLNVNVKNKIKLKINYHIYGVKMKNVKKFVKLF